MKLDYFSGERFIPNLTGDMPANEAIRDEVNGLISIYEEEFLRLLLGDDLYELFAAGIVETTPAAKWTALQAQIYNETTWTSPAADYVYFHYLQKSSSVIAGTGEVTTATSDPVQRMVRTWNRMSKAVGVIWEWMEDEDRKTDYSDFSRITMCYSNSNGMLINPLGKINHLNI